MRLYRARCRSSRDRKRACFSGRISLLYLRKDLVKKVMVMPKPGADRTKGFTYADYVNWEGDERWEVIDGVAYLQASPSAIHQRVVLRLGAEFDRYLRGKSCAAYVAPMDLTFESGMTTRNVVQPDLFVMCGSYTEGSRIVGIPTLVVEVLSPSTATQDYVRKMNLYQQVGIAEYWIVDPVVRVINVYRREDSRLRWFAEYKEGDALSPSMFPDLTIEVNTVFAL
ncbi:Endonuclease, Uma2 family (Restriction endonuclease fold) [Kyrpidia spormannii]|uniref:Endonuclease, Uma2 family (Restriction endonuclease fold) n=2 Tax=Kyrpidia spormannii TaxID=2055160 RepID=A0A6F9EID2_9BACL|nr:Endonuclease, Uma2 family (Restriction endonuclease fold) [Kyrpidia spormannii]